MNKKEVIEFLEKKRETALDNFEYYRDKENEKYEKMNRARVDSYTLAIQAVEKMGEAEKVEVPDFVAEWLENHPDAKELSSKFNWWNLSAVCGGYISDPEYIFASWFNDKANSYGNRRTLLKAILDGYTLKPKRWVVKSKDHIGLESFVTNTIIPVWTTEEPLWMTFTDKSKAEAVAVLVEGSVEEV
ncbi:DUF1642 domain-containing protein [Enterococcus dispar]|uniref:DUF1642 domain-containing protein n=1 Tax=Enterococcus dispar ATCC 51266 TaxID=1139219 RepID=S1N7D9_9ENTE|nr:DUF1642 domain-containing protein [Enterococcus dispar]EOT42617.1 hypothetical protein OMK_00978 [Enterococcus dispar ATCC 51266]EOW84932.1 hypothetical protein I569_00221 [Enterococcus dispar ATCC 51266]